jgi:hypothetical protein
MKSSQLPAIASIMALLVLATVMFFPVLFQGKILAPLDITTTLLAPWNESAGNAKPHNHNPSDAVTQYLPYRMFAEQSLKEDGYIGWNPYEMGGYSLAANTMALPGSWPMQLHRWLPFKDAWNLGIIGEFLTAGFGMLVFLRSRKLPWLPCLIGTVAFMFNAQFIVWIYHRWALGSFCWMPWVLWAYGDGFAFKPLPRRIFLLPAFLALALLGGTLQHVAFVFLCCGCVAAGAFDFRHPLANKPAVAGWTIAFLLAICLSAFSLIPQIQGYLANISVGHIRGGIGYSEGYTQPLLHALLIPARIWPWLAGDPQSIDGWRLLKSGFMDLNFIGTVPMLLAFFGLWIKGMPRAAKWLIAVGLVIPLTPLVGPLYHRVELLFVMGAAWMAAETLAYLQQNNSKQFWKRWLILGTSMIGAILIVGACIPASIRGKLESAVVTNALAKSGSSQFGADKEWIKSRATEWTRRFSITHPRTAWVYGLLLAGSAGLILASRRQPKAAITGHCLILCATSLELSTLFNTWSTFSKPENLHTRNAAIESMRTLAGPHRVIQSSPGAEFADVFATPNLLASTFVPSVDAYESIQYRSIRHTLSEQPEDVRLSLSGVGLAVHPTGKPITPGTETWTSVPFSDTYSLRKNPAVPPPAAAGLDEPPASPVSILPALANAMELHSTLKTTNRNNLTIPPQTRWLRISQNWHPGWKWRTPGTEWQTFDQGPDAACWIESVPAACTEIETRFFPRSRPLALFSLGSVVLWISLLPILHVIRPNRRSLPSAG